MAKRQHIKKQEKGFTQSPQTISLLKAVEILKQNKIISSDAELCRKLNTNIQAFNGAKRGRRNATVELIYLVCENFYVNPSFVLLGDEPVFLKSDDIKTALFNTKKKSVTEKDLINNITEELKQSAYLDAFLKINFWCDRIAFLVSTIKNLENEIAIKNIEINTLNKIISTHLSHKKGS